MLGFSPMPSHPFFRELTNSKYCMQNLELIKQAVRRMSRMCGGGVSVDGCGGGVISLPSTSPPPYILRDDNDEPDDE